MSFTGWLRWMIRREAKAAGVALELPAFAASATTAGAKPLPSASSAHAKTAASPRKGAKSKARKP